MGTLYRNDKACKDFIRAIADVERDDLAAAIKDAQFFVVMGHGSIDVSVIEQEGVFVRYRYPYDKYRYY